MSGLFVLLLATVLVSVNADCSIVGCVPGSRVCALRVGSGAEWRRPFKLVSLPDEASNLQTVCEYVVDQATEKYADWYDYHVALKLPLAGSCSVCKWTPPGMEPGYTPFKTLFILDHLLAADSYYTGGQELMRCSSNMLKAFRHFRRYLHSIMPFEFWEKSKGEGADAYPQVLIPNLPDSTQFMRSLAKVGRPFTRDFCDVSMWHNRIVHNLRRGVLMSNQENGWVAVCPAVKYALPGGREGVPKEKDLTVRNITALVTPGLHESSCVSHCSSLLSHCSLRGDDRLSYAVPSTLCTDVCVQAMRDLRGSSVKRATVWQRLLSAIDPIHGTFNLKDVKDPEEEEQDKELEEDEARADAIADAVEEAQDEVEDELAEEEEDEDTINGPSAGQALPDFDVRETDANDIQRGPEKPPVATPEEDRLADLHDEMVQKKKKLDEERSKRSGDVGPTPNLHGELDRSESNNPEYAPHVDAKLEEQIKDEAAVIGDAETGKKLAEEVSKPSAEGEGADKIDQLQGQKETGVNSPPTTDGKAQGATDASSAAGGPAAAASSFRRKHHRAHHRRSHY
eukprot:GILI01002272.1.p1 GENE.GILI01002272.1~~GILI01002272.1.p1  ORF type:complete len:567 (-),score=197.78 GILI01002272.1:711-2411(-)